MGRPAKARRLTEAEQAQVRERFARGAPAATLAREFRTSRWFITQAIRPTVAPGSRGGYAAEEQE